MCYSGDWSKGAGAETKPPPQTLGSAGKMGDDSTLANPGDPTSAATSLLGGANWQNTRNSIFRPIGSPEGVIGQLPGGDIGIGGASGESGDSGCGPGDSGGDSGGDGGDGGW